MSNDTIMQNNEKIWKDDNIVLATFDFRDDNSGQDMMAALLNAADRGVTTQMIYFLVIISTHIMRIGIFWSMKRFRVRVILTIRFKIILKIYGIFPAVEYMENMKELMVD